MYAVKSLCVTEPICWSVRCVSSVSANATRSRCKNVKNVRRSMAYAKRVNVPVVTAMLRMKSPQACGRSLRISRIWMIRCASTCSRYVGC